MLRKLRFLMTANNGRYVYDDAFITMRYARHMAQGFGPRWNLSGQPVEGFPVRSICSCLLY